MTATHIMLDLETWGKRPGCDIRSIGAVVFDPTGGAPDGNGWIGTLEGGEAFYIATDNPVILKSEDWGDGELWPLSHYDKRADEYRKYPLTRDLGTVKWWNDQSQDAQAAFADPVDLWKACYSFRYWLWQNSQPTERFEDWKPPETVRIWANGPQFDVSILEAVYHAVGLPVPWHYRAPRDFRTITDAAGITREEMQAFNHGTTHHALDDAISQARIVCEAYRRLGLQRT